MSDPALLFLPAPSFTWRAKRKQRTARHPAPKGNDQIVREVYIKGVWPRKKRKMIAPSDRVEAAEAAFVFALQRLPQCPSEPIEGDVQLEIDAVYVPPKGWEAWKRRAALLGTIRPTMSGYGFSDCSGLNKMIGDAFERSGWLDNDRLIAKIVLGKVFGDEPGYRFKLLELPMGPQSQLEAQGATQGGLFDVDS